MKRFFKNYFWILFVSVVVFTGCSTEQEVVNIDKGDSQGKVTFSFPMVKETTTYATVSATANESLFTTNDMIIFMVNGLDVVEKVFNATDIVSSGSGATPTASISIAGEITSAKTFYFVANTSSVSGLSSIVAGSSKLSDLLNLTTQTQSAQLSSSGGLLLTGSVTVQPDDLTSLTVAPIKVTLKRRVARFDVSNIAADSKVTIKEILISKVQTKAFIFSDKSTLPVTKGNLSALSINATSLANRGDSTSVFYIYPSDSVSIQLLATGFNGAERLYNITLPKEGIQANKRYTIKTSVSTPATFELAVDAWGDGGDVGVSGTNPIKILSSAVTQGYVEGWNGATLRYDVNKNTAATTKIELEVSTLTSKGVDVEVVDVPAGYTITASKGPAPTLTYASYTPQTVTITIPQYTLGAPLEAKVLIKDMYDQSQCRTVVITREDYYPTPHKGWAGCNIYYDEVKGHLIFDDVSVTTHEQYQGVYFKWGSLWGISPKDDWSGNTITLYPPAGGAVPSSDAPISSTWGNIPRIPDAKYTPADEVMYRDWAYVYQVTDSTSGRGDICKYLTDKGWAPAGKKWRMPTSNEFGESETNHFYSDFITDTYDAAVTAGTNLIRSGRFLTNVTPNVFFPASGYRDYNTGDRGCFGERGYAWSGSPASKATYGYILWFEGGSLNPAYSYFRTYGRPVRCVVE